MEIINSLILEVSKVATYIVYVISMYYLFISFFGLRRRKDEEEIPPKKSFALIIAAHNEEIVIGNTVQSLLDIDYPRELYDIYVIADNCTDRTAHRAREKGALVYERHNIKKVGKGYALEWMFDKLFKMDKKYDAVAIFDADNLVHKNFLREVNKKMCKNYKVVQGYLDSKNPVDTWITGSYSIAFWTSNRMFQLSRSNLGLSNQLGGTGFCIDIDILKELGWGATCLTEDLEFTCKLVLNGYKVGWAHDAIIYDEKPLTLKHSWSQRRRWMQGFADVSHRYFFKLMKRAVTKFDFKALDCALYTIQPIVIILTGFSMAASIFNYLVKAYNIMINFNTHINIYSMNFKLVALLGILVSIVQFIYTPFILLLDKKLSPKIFWYYLIYPIYTITWLPISIQGILRKNDKVWSHTPHTRDVHINELEKAN
ncbi:glycosyltransferase family 2 protein [uncultured Clostridium sp.]|uniref:glycosyltransferase family 2 protein n=1 Tax=uncultured Clostridium sp. TaxID=59620 RepID=UPI0028E189D9|nr:glycosyltransferase family 2 protein [uncultured Clostridium sp.]